MTVAKSVFYLLGIILAPVIPGIINRTKAVFSGRKGQPLLQLYFDLWKLFHKKAVYSRTTSIFFRIGPRLGLVAALIGLAFVPWSRQGAIVSFPGDFLLLMYLFAMSRFFTILAALDTGSSFAGMGASREAFFSCLAEPAWFLGFLALARLGGSSTLAGMLSLPSAAWRRGLPEVLLVGIAWVIVYLVENARIPFDDPNTHLELTMIHEVMVLDHSAAEWGLIQAGSALKLMVLGIPLVRLLTIPAISPWGQFAWTIAALVVLAVLVGVIESVAARLRLLRIPQMLIAAAAIALLAVILTFGGK